MRFYTKKRHQALEVNIISQQWFLDFTKYEIATFICILLKNNGFIMQQFAIQIYEKQNKIGLTYIRENIVLIYHSIDMNICNKNSNKNVFDDTTKTQWYGNICITKNVIVNHE